jgi:tetratricopeptide (TPR) repeat protein
MEAAWLTAVALIPCLHSPYTEYDFGPEKAALLHGLAALIAGAWLARVVMQRRAGQGSGGPMAHVLWRGPLAWCLAALLGAYFLSSGLSVDPGQSLWGNFQTRSGAYTFGCYVFLFAAIAANLRRMEQVERLVNSVLVGSLLLALYAVIQRLHLDPINWGPEITVGSLTGHPLYLAGYLGMVFPLCLWRIVGLWRPAVMRAGSTASHPAPRPSPLLKGRGGTVDGQVVSAGPRFQASVLPSGYLSKCNMGAVALHCLLGTLQLATLLLTQKRGPLLALMVALVFFFVLVSVRMGLRRLLVMTMLVGVVMMVFLLVLNIPHGPLEGLRSTALLNRFAHGMFSASEGTGFFRADLWKQCPALMLSQQPIRRPDGAPDTLHLLRPWFGYGPETASGVLAQRYTVPHSSATLEDRFHQLVWDLWENVGALGVAAFLGFFVALMWWGLRQLGLIGSRGDTLWLLGLVLFCSLAVAVILSMWRGAGFTGLGLQFGIAAGCVLYPFTKLWSSVHSRQAAVHAPPSTLDVRALLVIALLSACLLHLVETGFAFPTFSTAVLFWAFAGLLVALGRQLGGLAEPEPDQTDVAQQPVGKVVDPKSQNRPAKSGWEASQKHREVALGARRGSLPGLLHCAIWPAALTTMVLIPMMNMFLMRYTHEGLSALDFINYALDPVRAGSAGGNIVPVLLLAVWLGSALLLTSPGMGLGRDSAWLGRFVATALLSAGLVACYGLWNGSQLASIGPLPSGAVEGWGLLKQAAGYESIHWTSMAVLLALVLAAGYACSGLPAAQLRKPATIGLLGGLAALTVATALLVDAQTACADISLRWASVLHSQKVWPGCQEVFERAIKLRPRQFIYPSRLAQALHEQAERTADDAGYNQLNGRAEAILQAAKGMPGYNRRAWHLGQLYLDWAQHETNLVRRVELAAKAKSALQEALLWEPYNPPLWSDYGFVDVVLLHNEAEGLREYQKALDLDSGCAEALGRLANYYFQKSAETGDPAAKRSYMRKAANYYALTGANSSAPFPYFMACGDLLMHLQEWPEAIKQYRVACDLAGNAEASRAYEMLARAYFAAGDRVSALKHLQLAIEKAGPQQSQALLELEKQFGGGNRENGKN